MMQLLGSLPKTWIATLSQADLWMVPPSSRPNRWSHRSCKVPPSQRSQANLFPYWWRRWKRGMSFLACSEWGHKLKKHNYQRIFSVCWHWNKFEVDSKQVKLGLPVVEVMCCQTIIFSIVIPIQSSIQYHRNLTWQFSKILAGGRI